MLKKGLNISLWVVFVAGIMMLMSFISDERESLMVDMTSAEIEIEKPEGHVLVTKDEIMETVMSMGYDTITNLSALNLSKIEDGVRKMPALEHAEAFRTLDGKLKITVIQRTPVLRVIHSNGTSNYVDSKGDVIPVIKGHPVKVLVATGNIENPGLGTNVAGMQGQYSTKKMNELFRMTQFIRGHNLWKDQVQEIHVNKDGEFEITPRVGDHRIMFGSIEDMEKKFKKLEIFYREGLQYTDWNAFDTLNLKFKDQIVCTKK